MANGRCAVMNDDLRLYERRFLTLAGMIALLMALFSLGFAGVAAGEAAALNNFNATNTPRPTDGPAPEPTSTAAPIVAAEESVVTVGTRSGADIHAEPDADSDLLGRLSAGASPALTGQASVDGVVWYQMALDNAENDATHGWVRSDAAFLVLRWRRVVETFETDFGEIEMVKVPAGCFVMGSERFEDDESPAHTQCFSQPFYIDRFAVSNRQFGSEGYFSGDSRPREMVNWQEAAAHCEARGARLPTEAEWEYAARGPMNPVYPWGDDFVDDNVVSSWRTTARQTEAVGAKPEGASWVGAINMSGNVWEWTSTLYDAYPYDDADGREDAELPGLRVVRGGACCSYVIADVRAGYRFAVDPFMADPNIGFRCARDFEPDDE